jgi:hypothetical protein
MIIGLAGFKGSGKDTVAAYLVKKHGFERKAYADPLKQSIAALFDIPFTEVDRLKNDDRARVAIGDLEEQRRLFPIPEYPVMSFRQILQRYGTEAHRDVFGQDFWLEYTLPSNGYYSGRSIVVTDVRFANEVKRIKDFGGSIWLVDRVTDRSSFDPHASEKLDFGTDLTVPNRGTIDDLYARIEEALSATVG